MVNQGSSSSDRDSAAFGARVLLTVRVVLLATILSYFGLDLFGVDIPVEIWLIPAVVAFVALVVCRRRERRVRDMSGLIFLSGVMAVVVGVPGTSEGEPFMIATLAIGVVILILSVVWRPRRRPVGTR
jgi:peptidoglycan/LPS O-acetylase OafA/YrhL